LHELNRRSRAQRGTTTLAVVEHFGVLEQIANGFLSRAVALSVYALILQAVEETLSGGVVPAVALRLIEQRMP